MPSYVARPNKSMSADFSWSIESSSSSSPQMESCQPRSQLFAPSKKPSRETTFHMMTFLISLCLPWLGHKRRAYFYLHPMGFVSRAGGPEALLSRFRIPARAGENVERGESESPHGDSRTPDSEGGP